LDCGTNYLQGTLEALHYPINGAFFMPERDTSMQRKQFFAAKGTT